MQILGRNGGYILAPCHNIQAVGPAENVVAMHETGYQHGLMSKKGKRARQAMIQNNDNSVCRRDKKQKPATVVIACGNLKAEIDSLLHDNDAIEVRYMDHDLHRRPERMPPVIQTEIDAVEAYASDIVLGYGLCSYGTAGLIAPEQGLWIPRVHDCMALFLGSRAAYDREFQSDPGSYYLTEAWINNNRDPLGTVENDYAPRLGYETALWAMEQELKHYTRIALINTQSHSKTMGRIIRERAQENARRLNKEYTEITSDMSFFKRLLFGPYSGPDFVYVDPGKEVERATFECAHHCAAA